MKIITTTIKKGSLMKRFMMLFAVACVVLSVVSNRAYAELDTQTTQEVHKAVDEYLALKQKTPGQNLDSFLGTVKGGRITIGGELEYEFVDAQNDAAETEPHFQLDKFVLHPKVYLSDDIYLDAQLYFKPHGKTYLNEFHLVFDNLPFCNAYLDIGQYERQIKTHANRTTEDYPLIGTAFYRDDEYAISLGGGSSRMYWSLLVGDGLELGGKQVAEDASYKIIHDNRKEEDFTGLSEFNANIGYRHDYGKVGKVDLLLYYVYKELSDNDIEFLMDLPDYNGGHNEDNGYRYGFGVDYQIAGLRLYGQYIAAKDGTLERHGWYVQPSYKFKVPNVKYFSSHELLVRYGELDVDIDNTLDNPYTWDRQKITIALITDIYKNIKLKVERYINQEDTGDDEDVDNDEFMAQLEVKF